MKPAQVFIGWGRLVPRVPFSSDALGMPWENVGVYCFFGKLRERACFDSRETLAEMGEFVLKIAQIAFLLLIPSICGRKCSQENSSREFPLICFQFTAFTKCSTLVLTSCKENRCFGVKKLIRMALNPDPSHHFPCPSHTFPPLFPWRPIGCARPDRCSFTLSMS